MSGNDAGPAGPMNGEEMLRILGEHGEDAGSDYNDSDAVDGWFGWTVTAVDGVAVLTVTHQPSTADGRAGETQSAHWHLIRED